MKNYSIRIFLLYMVLATYFLSLKAEVISNNSNPIVLKDPTDLKVQNPKPATNPKTSVTANIPTEDPYAIPDISEEEINAKEAAEKEAAAKAWMPDPANPDLPKQWRTIPGKMATITMGKGQSNPILVGLDASGKPFKFDAEKKSWLTLPTKGVLYKKNPLKITKALYGKYGISDGSVRDVTAQVQKAVQGSTLNINANDGPLGGDPRRGQKMFWVWWEYNGRKQSTYAFQGANVTITPEVRTNNFAPWDDDRGRANKRVIAWPEEWKLPEDSNGTFYFSSDAKEDLHIALRGDSGSWYMLVIGGWGNRKSVIRKDFQHDIARTDVGMPGDRNNQQYWVTLDKKNNRLTMGTGPTAGNNTFISWPLPANNLRYFSFTTYCKAFHIGNIRVEGNPNIETFVIDPTASPQLSFKDIAVAGDGSIAAITNDGSIWVLQDQAWIQVQGTDAESVSMGSANELWIINKNKLVYRKKNHILTHPDWAQPNGAQGLSVGASGEGYVLLAGTDQKIYTFNRETALFDFLIKPADMGMGNPFKIKAIDKLNIAFLDYQKRIWKLIPGTDPKDNDSWTNITETLEVKDFCLGNDGSIIIVDTKDRIIQRTLTKEEQDNFETARGDIIYGGQIVSLSSSQNTGNAPVWTNSWSVFDSEGKNQPPNNYLEACVSKPSSNNYLPLSGSFFMITNKQNESSNDPIKFGDTVSIWSLFAAGSDPKKAGALSKEWKWWVSEGSNTLNEIIISLISHPNTQNGYQDFQLISPAGKQGIIHETDIVEIVSMSPQCKGRKVWTCSSRNNRSSLFCPSDNWTDNWGIYNSGLGEQNLAGFQQFQISPVNKITDILDTSTQPDPNAKTFDPKANENTARANLKNASNRKDKIKAMVSIPLAIKADASAKASNDISQAQATENKKTLPPREVFAKISGGFFKVASAQTKVDKDALKNIATDGIGVFKEVRNYTEFNLNASEMGIIKPQDARQGLNRDLLTNLTIKGFSKESEIKDFGPSKMIQLDKLWSQGVAWITESLETPGKATISFLARSGDQGNVQVAFNNSLQPDAKWRVIIGGWNNSKARILRGNQIMAEADTKTTHLAAAAPGRFTPYWVSINNGFIMAGVGSPGENVFMSCLIPDPEQIDRYGFSSHDGNVDYTEVNKSGALQAWADANYYQANEPNLTLPAKPKDVVWLKSQLRVPNEGTITFNAQAKHSVTLVLQNAKKENYKIVIGANKNKELRIMKGEEKPALQIFTGQTGQGKLFSNKKTNFWISIQGGRFIIGQGEPGENTFGVWEDQLPLTNIVNVGFETTDHQQTISNFKFSPPVTIGTEQEKSTYDKIVDRFPYKGSILLIRYFEFQFAQDGQHISAKDMVTGQNFHIFPTPQQGARYILKLDIQADGTPSVTQLEGPHESPTKIALNRQAALQDIDAAKLKDQAEGTLKAGESLGKGWSTGSGVGSIIASAGSLVFAGVGAGVYAAGASKAADAAKTRLQAQLGYRADDSPVFTEAVSRASGLKPGDIPDAAVENKKIVTDLLNQARFLSFNKDADYIKLLALYLDALRRVSHAYVVEDSATKQSIYDALDEFQDAYKLHPDLYPKVMSLFVKAFSNNYLTSSSNKDESLRRDRWYTAMLDICSNVFEESFQKDDAEIDVAELRGEYLWLPRQFIGGKGSITFEAKGQNDIFVCLAQQDYKVKDPSNNIYEFDFGAWGNTTIEARIRSLGKPAMKISAAENPAYKQLMLNPRRFQAYWISFDSGHVQIGAGNVVGENMFIDWQDPFPWKDTCYIGFGSWNVPVTIRNIKLTNVKSVSGTVNLDQATGEEPAEKAPQDPVDAESADLANDEQTVDEEQPANEEQAE